MEAADLPQNLQPQKPAIVQHQFLPPKPSRKPTRVGWTNFQNYFYALWDQGQHVSLLGPTGRGKTFLSRQILPRRDHVVVFDVKGDDPVLRNLPGFTTIYTWPPDVNQLPKVRLTLPPRSSESYLPTFRREMQNCLAYIFKVGCWCVVFDESRAVADPKFFRLGQNIERLMLYGRSRNITVVNTSQAPRWIPRSMYDQATHIFLWENPDEEAKRRLGEIGGDTLSIRHALKGLRQHEFLYVNTVHNDFLVSKVEV